MSTEIETISEADAEFAVLTTDQGQALLSFVAATARPGPAELDRWRKVAPADWVRAAIRLVETRRRGAAKYTRADRMWLDPVGLEQATAEIVARHKAQRFDGHRVVDFCSGIGGDALALAQRNDVVAVDRNPDRCRRLAWNARVYEVTERLLPVVGDAEHFGLPERAWIHIDPDRRANPTTPGRRARRIDDYIPGMDVIHGLLNTAEGSAIKLSPASDFETAFAGRQVEIELISLGGECKEATVWGGNAVTCWRRATRLPDGATWTDRDGQAGGSAGVLPQSSWAWVYDPDPALIRSGLLESFAVAHGLGRLSGAAHYLASSLFVASPFLAAFEVEDIFPLDLKLLKRELTRRDVGTLEIKVRGANITPETLRAKLKLKGSQSATILVEGQGPTRAILARRVGPP